MGNTRTSLSEQAVNYYGMNREVEYFLTISAVQMVAGTQAGLVSFVNIYDMKQDPAVCEFIDETEHVETTLSGFLKRARCSNNWLSSR